ncbi:MAG TPA: AraC family transcriptional regulator [Panacibacter sp.]|nr:AraC family transcriptional regulator [Panacibacter sp.]HNP45088.1 AraC family transcriptional regulator [Panacibacter sp.]
MSFSFSDILYLFVLFLLLFIAIFLFTADRGKKISNVLLALFFLALWLNLTDNFLLLKQFYLQFPQWGLWGSSMLLLCGPLLFFYVRSVLYKQHVFTKKSWLHFLPFLLLLLATETGFLSAGERMQMQIMQDILNRKLPSQIYLGGNFIYLHFTAYLIASLLLLKKYQKAAVNQFSNAQHITLNWLKTLVFFFLFLLVFGAVNSYLLLTGPAGAYFVALSLLIVVLLLFIVFVLMKALNHPGMFSGWEEQAVQENVQPPKYAGAGLGENEKQLVLQNIQQYMQLHKPYLDPELTLDDLSVKMKLKPKIVSQIINEMLEQNFFEFINTYRIEEAKRLLTKPKDKKITVLEVMYDVGFNSKSSFNTLFKKYTGITPTEFRKQHA